MSGSVAQCTAGHPSEPLWRGSKDVSLAILHSGRFHPRWATRSVVGRPVAWFRHWCGGHSELISGEGCPDFPTLSHNLWQDLRTLLGDRRFPGSWIGYFSYELARLIEPRKLGARETDWPLVELGWCPTHLEVPAGIHATDELSRAREAAVVEPGGLLANFDRGGYERAVRRALEYIAAGDVFQVNVAQRFSRSFRGEPRALYDRLSTISPAWYGAYLELPEGRVILSTSPELFLRLEGRRVVTRPIKGTAPGWRDTRELAGSAKDAAELNMIVDLMRNDLGRVCSYGSVRVSEPRTIETHPGLHHGVATVEGQMHPTMDCVDLLRATLPAGSVTGAPKVRAMQIIDELEPDSRGPYCGAIGRIWQGGMELNVAIRTIFLRQGGGGCYEAHFSVGSGIVADSKPDLEYEETLTKAAPMIRALNQDT